MVTRILSFGLFLSVLSSMAFGQDPTTSRINGGVWHYGSVESPAGNDYDNGTGDMWTHSSVLVTGSEGGEYIEQQIDVADDWDPDTGEPISWHLETIYVLVGETSNLNIGELGVSHSFGESAGTESLIQGGQIWDAYSTCGAGGFGFTRLQVSYLGTNPIYANGVMSFQVVGSYENVVDYGASGSVYFGQSYVNFLDGYGTDSLVLFIDEDLNQQSTADTPVAESNVSVQCCEIVADESIISLGGELYMFVDYNAGVSEGLIAGYCVSVLNSINE